MGNAEKLRSALARGVKSALGRTDTKRALKARRKVSRNAPGSASASPDMYGIGMPGGRLDG